MGLKETVGINCCKKAKTILHTISLQSADEIGNSSCFV